MDEPSGRLTFNMRDGTRREYVATAEMVELARQLADGELASDEWYRKIEALLILSGQTPPGFFDGMASD